MSENLLNEFIFDAREHLSTAGARLLELEKDPGNLEPLNSLMGTLHTLKGNSGFLDLQNLYKLMHQAESLLQTIREKKVDCPQPVIDLLLQVLDTCEAILNSLAEDGQDTVDWLGSLNQALREAEEHLEEDETPGPVDHGDEDYSHVYEAARPASSHPDPGLNLEINPGAASLVTLADGDLDRAGDHFTSRVEALFKAGGSGLVVDLKGLTNLTGPELKLLLAASLNQPDRVALVVDPAEQQDLHRLFQVLDPDQRLNIFPDQAPALAHLGQAT
ncbi:MAG: Hpt domain-containing protein [Candidatus Adiutrix sp.]|jgi:chemotaxis protein histidine kinase CheA|nr:Hpt domain-containing protein [Candidatus Adiutrix sp.]